VGKARIFQHRPPLISRDLLGPLQHLVHLIEIEITEQWGNHSTLGNTSFPGRLENQLEEVHDILIIDPPGHLLAHDMMTHRVEIGAQVQVNYLCLAIRNGDCYTWYRVMR